MRALIFDYPPPPPQPPKDAAPAAPVLGSRVYAYDVAGALARCGTYDAYYHLDRNPLTDRPCPRAAVAASARCTSISPTALDSLRRHEHVILMTPRTSPQGLVSLRSRLGNPPRPITACIHTLSGSTAPYLALGLVFANLGAHDAVLCSTHAGRLVVERLLDCALDVIQVRERPRVRLPVIPLGTDCSASLPDRTAARREAGFRDAETVLLYVGRLSASTKCDLGPLLMMFAGRVRQGGSLRLVIAGDDTEHRSAGTLRRWCAALGCGDRVTLRPDVTDVERRRLLAAADVFVSFSDNIQETFGLTIIEAMAAGLPVIASDWDGYRELVTHGVNGFLVPTAWPALDDRFDLSAPPAIAENLNAMLAAVTSVDCDAAAHYVDLLAANPTLRRQMGTAAALEARRRFDWPVIVRQYEDLWSELVANARGAATRLHAFGPLAYRCQEVFGVYPTHAIGDDRTLIITENGRWWLDLDARLDAMPGTPGSFRHDVLRRLALALAQDGPMTMGGLIRTERSEELSDLAIRLHVGRLLKYGIVRAARPAPPATPVAT